MLDRKQSFFRLIEYYINNFRRDAVETIYGNNSKIKIHSMSESFSTNVMLFEVVVILGEKINESIIDDTLTKILVEDALLYFFPEKKIQTYVRFDV